MRTIIAGSRQGVRLADVRAAVDECGWEITQVISGTARGADRLGEAWATEHGIPISRFPAEWGGLGPRAGYLRNLKMAEAADALIAVWDGDSGGTRNMIDVAMKRNLLVSVYLII